MMIEVAVEAATIRDGALDVVTRVRVKTVMPAQNEDLPHVLEETAFAAGQEFMRAYYREAIERADLELVMSNRGGRAGKGIQRLGRRRYTFKTRFGTVKVKRIRIRHKADGRTETPSARAWRTPKQVMIVQGLKNTVCDLVAKESYNNTVRQLERESGEEKLISKTTVGNILHQEGARLAATQQARAEQVFAADAEATVLLGRAAAHIAEDYFKHTFLKELFTRRSRRSKR